MTAELGREALAERELRADEVSGGPLLAIDTALGTSVAVGADGRIVEVSSDDPRRHAEVIDGLIASALQLAEVPADAVAGVVAGIGPGPFTGLRVGIAAAHAFALTVGHRWPSATALMPLQGHEAVALAVLDGGSVDAGVRVVQDARRRELFVTEYDGLDQAGLPSRSADPHLMPRTEYIAAAHEVWPERIPAARLVQLAARRISADRAFEPDRALYLRQPDVKQPSAPKRVST